MKKYIFALTLVVFVLVLPGCINFPDDSKKNLPTAADLEQYEKRQKGIVSTPEEIEAMKDRLNKDINKTEEKAEVEPEEDPMAEAKKMSFFDSPVSFSGPATGTAYFCLSDCSTCPTTGTIDMVLLPDGTMKAGYTTDCYVYGIDGCEKRDKCLYEITGGYNKVYGSLLFSTCSGSNTTTGKGSFDDNTSTGSITCMSDSEMNTEIEWSGISVVK